MTIQTSFEERYAELLRGGFDRSPLATDGYKFSMAQAGNPLRHETFYLHFRKGGGQFLPFNFAEVIQLLKPRPVNSREQGFLAANGYAMTSAMEVALQGDLEVWGQPKHSWANEHEPLVTPSGPSFLVSWMEAMGIAFHFPIQIATAIKSGVYEFKATCEDEAAIIYLVEEALDEGGQLPADSEAVSVDVYEDAYRANLRDHLKRLKAALGGDIHRAFEVGTRSMSCMQMHRICLEECKAAGIHRTANVKLAYDLYMIPVGTTGHEHQKRHGADINGFRAVRDRRPEPPSYLFDTYDPINSGIPAAILAMREDRRRRASCRFDSGDQPKQLRLLRTGEKEHGLNVFYLFMDGYDDVRTGEMDTLAAEIGVARDDRHFGLGSYLVSSPAPTEYTRDRLAMVYKLCESGGPNAIGRRNVRKYGGSIDSAAPIDPTDPGKASIAGHPFVLMGSDRTRYICQQGEGFAPPGGTFLNLRDAGRPTGPSVLSPGTLAVNEACRVRDIANFEVQS